MLKTPHLVNDAVDEWRYAVYQRHACTLFQCKPFTLLNAQTCHSQLFVELVFLLLHLYFFLVRRVTSMTKEEQRQQ